MSFIVPTSHLKVIRAQTFGLNSFGTKSLFKNPIVREHRTRRWKWWKIWSAETNKDLLVSVGATVMVKPVKAVFLFSRLENFYSCSRNTMLLLWEGVLTKAPTFRLRTPPFPLRNRTNSKEVSLVDKKRQVLKGKTFSEKIKKVMLFWRKKIS